VFFGLDKSKRALLDAGVAVVCEGQLDLIAGFLAGVENVVAPLGTAFTEEHARLLKRYVEEVILCFDSDEAGQKAAVRSLDHLLASGLAVRVALVPAPDDPDSFIKTKGGPAFKQLIAGAEDFFDYYLNRLCRQNDVNSDKGRRAVLNDMAGAVQKTGSPVLEDKYAQKTALRLGVSPEAVRAEFKKIKRAQPAPAPAADAGSEAVPEETSFEALAQARPSDKEFWLLKLLLCSDELLPLAERYMDSNWIPHPLVRSVMERRLAKHINQTWQGLGGFLGECESEGMRTLITEAVTEERKIPNMEQQLADVILRLRNEYLARLINETIQKLNQPGLSNENEIELMRLKLDLIKQRQSQLVPMGGS
jgi:DNA primase